MTIALGLSLIEGTRTAGGLPDADIVAALDRWAAKVAKAGDGILRWPACFAVWCDVSDPVNRAAPRGWRPPSVFLLADVVARGIVPVVHLETSRWPCAEIAAGAHDDLLAEWARLISAHPGQVLVRLDQEPNGSQGSWTQDKGTPPEDYVAMWQHVVTLMRPIAPELRWVWCVVARGPKGVAEFDRWWPDVVDIVACDVYDAEGDGKPSFASRAMASIDKLTAYGEPVMVAEAGIAKKPGNDLVRARSWATLSTCEPRLIAASYFDMAPPGEGVTWTMTGALLRQHAAMMADAASFTVATPPRLVP